MKVQEVRRVARQWVEDQFADNTDFVGAHFMGALNELAADDEFPSFSDVDLGIVLEGKRPEWPTDVEHQGLMLELGIQSADDYRSLESLVSNPSLAPNLVMDSVFVDPQGELKNAHQYVSREFNRRRWVEARCRNVKNDRIERFLGDLAESISPPLNLALLMRLISSLCGYIALANLARPTHRKALIRAREILEDKQALHLHSALLDLFGCAQWDTAQVDECLAKATTAFDLATEIYKTPQPGDFKLKTHLRPYFVQASQDMMARGFHREAVPWIMLFYAISVITIDLDGSIADKNSHVSNGFLPALGDLGLSTPEDWRRRSLQGKDIAEDIYRFGDQSMADHPEIV